MMKEPALSALDWPQIIETLDERGFAVTPPLLDEATCRALRGLYDDEALFRKRVVMARQSYGRGEYQYFSNPLPETVEALRQACYPHLATLANRWEAALGRPPAFPDTLNDYLAACHKAGQCRPTPLMLRYGPGDYNRLHQDLYGPLHFPLQMAILLSRPDRGEDGGEFEGGEFVLTEQRVRVQSRVQVVPLTQGQAVIFSVNQRPARGARGFHRVTMRHGVSDVRSGERFTLGIIFHDAA